MSERVEKTAGKRHLVDAFTGRPIYRWQLRILSSEPTEIDFKEIRHDAMAPMGELYKLIRRTSYMVEGPNREVKWSLEIQPPGTDEWRTVAQGKSTLQAGKGPE